MDHALTHAAFFLFTFSFSLFPFSLNAGQREPIVFHTEDELRGEAALRKELHVLHNRLQEELGVPPLEVNVEIYVLRDAEGYRKFVRQSIPGVSGRGRRAIFLLREGIPYIITYQHSRLDESLRHEFVHAVLNTAHKNLPIWIDEGLAEYYQVADGSGWRRAHAALLKQRDGLFWQPSLARIERLKKMSQMGILDYAEAWSWTHLLLRGPQEFRGIVPQYLAGLRKEAPTPTISERVAAVGTDATRSWRQHHEISGKRLALPAIPFASKLNPFAPRK